MSFSEINFDGLVGPTHNYSGLSSGNIASMSHGSQASNPKEAALQGLKKMELMVRLGIPQAVLPPQERPSIHHLKRLGFTGKDSEILAEAAKKAPYLLNSCSSASSMWTANSCTFTPSLDSDDGKAHFTPANLASKLHRSIERRMTQRVLKTIFSSSKHFVHHEPLIATDALGDEGAANHTRLAPKHGEKGIHLFVYGKSNSGEDNVLPKKFPARQAREASHSVARLHGISDNQLVLARQSAAAIDAGVFHNDVISVGNENVFFFHEMCFADEKKAVSEMLSKWARLEKSPLELIRVSSKQVSLEDAVKTYLFNSQLVTLPSGKMALIAPQECEQSRAVKSYLDSLIKSAGPITEVHYPALRESMHNGGGPACLRLRVVLSNAERKAALSDVFLEEKKIGKLKTWVEKHYRDRLLPADLADPKLIKESRVALDELTQILDLGSIYPFQRSED